MILFDFDRFKKLCKDNGTNPARVASRIGKSRAYFSDLKNGRFTVKENDLNEIAKILGTTPDYLTGVSDDAERDHGVYLNDLDEDTKEVLKMCMEHKGLAKKLLDLAEALSK